MFDQQPPGRPALRIARLRAVDLQQIDFRAPELALIARVGDLATYGQHLAGSGIAYAGWIGDHVVGCAGVLQLHTGVGEAWALLGNALPDGQPSRLWVAVSIVVRWGIREAFRVGYHRIQTVVAADMPPAIRWVRRLGFAFEGPLVAYGPDRRDYLRFATFRADVFKGGA